MSLNRREAGQEAAWRWALARAAQGFERGGGSAAPARLRAAAKLELDLALGSRSTTPEAACRLLEAVYAGVVDAALLESGRVHLWATAGASEVPEGASRRSST